MSTEPIEPSDDFQFIEFDEKVVKESIGFDELFEESELATYQSNLSKPRKSAKKVTAAYYIGDRGGGKTTAIEQDAEDYYNEWLSSWYIWGSRSNENVFVAVNRNCKRKWDEAREKLERFKLLAKTLDERLKYEKIEEQLEERIHCNCDKAYPINWLVPDYWKFKGVYEYNYCWSGKEEFDRAWNDGWITRPFEELSKEEKEKLFKRRLKKPQHLIKTDMIRICPFTVPNSAKNKEIFERQYLKYAFEARLEHRWLIMNPLMFLNEKDKFSTIGYIFERLKYWVDQFWQPSTPMSVAELRGKKEPIPELEWTKQEKSFGKIHLTLPEIRTLAPPHSFSPEKQSTLAKRPIIDMIPELRHLRIWFDGDLQSYDDLNENVRKMANYVVIKQGGYEIFGDQWAKFIAGIEKLRKERLIAMSHGKFDEFKKAPFELKQMIDKDLPSVSEIPKNRGYVVFKNGEFYLERFSMARFHHKKETETVQSVTGITWELNKEKVDPSVLEEQSGTINDEKSSKKSQNNDRLTVLKWCAKEFIICRNWQKVSEKLKVEVTSNTLPQTGIENHDHKILSNTVRSNEKIRGILNYAKKNKQKQPEEILGMLDK